MIGLILGTSEGKTILELLNKYTDDIFISTATEYGGELLKDYRYKVMNTKPLDLDELIVAINKNGINIILDASHPYAEIITKNALEACNRLDITYVRYERPKVKKYDDDHVVFVKDYEELYLKIKDIKATILNTTGSTNLDKFMDMHLTERVIHRVLPSIKVMERCFTLGVDTGDIIAIKGPVSEELNCSFIKEYNAGAIILKDSGTQGGTDEKIKAAIFMGITAFVIARKPIEVPNTFNSEEDVVRFIQQVRE